MLNHIVTVKTTIFLTKIQILNLYRKTSLLHHNSAADSLFARNYNRKRQVAMDVCPTVFEILTAPCGLRSVLEEDHPVS